jgi:hypothetical protein
MIIKNVITAFIFSWKNILPLKYKFSMIKMFEGDLERLTTNLRLELNHLFALCQWD